MKPEIKSAAVDWPTVMRALAGGGLAGLGIGATTTLLSHLNALQEKANQSQDTSNDDNVIYLNLRRPQKPGMKMASANNAPTFALAGLAGLGGMYGAYSLVRGMHQKMRKKQLQRELDDSQQIYLDNLTRSNGFGKSASQYGLLTKGVGGAYMAAMLAALGSGVIANRIMQKQFPSIQDPMRDRPKKIVIRSVGPNGQPEEDVEPVPDASPEGVESLLRNQLANKRAAVNSGFAGLVDMAASGRCEQIKEALSRDRDDKIEILMSRADGFQMEKVSGLNRNLAVSWIAHDPLVSHSVQPLLAAEFQDWAPGYCKWAAFVDAEDREVGDALVGVAEETTRLMRAGGYQKVLRHVKSANEHEGIPGPLKVLVMADALKKMLSENQDRDISAEITQGAGDVPKSQDSPAMNGVNMEISDPDAEHFYQKNHRAVDSAVSRYT